MFEIKLTSKSECQECGSEIDGLDVIVTKEIPDYLEIVWKNILSNTLHLSILFDIQSIFIPSELYHAFSRLYMKKYQDKIINEVGDNKIAIDYLSEAREVLIDLVSIIEEQPKPNELHIEIKKII